MKKFALIGAAGFVAPRHLAAIKETGNEVIATMDKTDSVGVLDHYFPQADFFTEIERFDRYIDKQRRENNSPEYLTVCTPNYLHDAHVRFGLKHGLDVVCEKPLVLNPWNVEPLLQLEKETGKKIWNVLQLRMHPDIIKLKEKSVGIAGHTYNIDLAYITPRGRWYATSWKGDETKSGGIATNIGIHFFDMLIWIFGAVKQNIVHTHKQEHAAGFLELERATVRWFLSIDAKDLPSSLPKNNGHAFRAISVDGEQMEFSNGFANLHTKSYEAILAGNGFGINDALPSIELVHNIRTQSPVGLIDDYHPMASRWQ